MKKDVSKNKLLLCFRPVVVDNMDLVLESKGAVKTHSMIKSSTLESKKSENPTTLRPQKRKLSCLVKAVVFEIILAKRARDRKGSRQNSRESSCVLSTINSTVSEDKDASKNRVFDSPPEIKSNYGLSSSSSFDSSSTSESKIKVSKSLSDSKDRKSSYSISLNSGICLLLMSLTLTILWGKLYAILFTSIWLYLPSRRTREVFRPRVRDIVYRVQEEASHNGRET